MKSAVFIALGLLIYFLVCLWARTKLRYHISSRHFRITWLGVCLRRIPLKDISQVTKKRRGGGWTENWCNTLQPSHRMLFIYRSRGLRRNLVFTPPNRYIFKTELERALGQLPDRDGLAPEPESETVPAGENERSEAPRSS